ncbi:MAG: hypothetical protein FJ104_00965 [Deltaproteobacteria bacterium]|nr:hypothetical protein [Deltaproteobacteria bacterium]
MRLALPRSSSLWIALVPSLLALACGGTDDTAADESGAGAGDAGGAPSLPDPNEKLTALPDIDPSQGFQVDEGQFTLQPGDDVTYCMRIPLPVSAGEDMGLVGWDWDLPEYTHHFFMAYSEAPFDSEVPTPCDGKDAIVFNDLRGIDSLASLVATDGTSPLGEGKLIFGAGVGIGRYMGNEQYGRRLGSKGHLIISHHALNTSDSPQDMGGRFNMYVRPMKEIAFETNLLNCLSLDVTMGPREEREVTTTCTMPHDLDMVLLASHGHNHMVKFEERIFDGEKTLPEVIYTSDVWDSPKLQFLEKPLRLKKGQGLTFTCYYKNESDDPVLFSTNEDGEMCATMNAYAMPNPNQPTPTLGTIIQKNDPPTCLTLDENNQVVTAPNCDLQNTTDLAVPIPFF